VVAMRIKFTVRNADDDEDAIIMSHRWDINAWHEYRQYFEVLGYDTTHNHTIVRPDRLHINNIYKFRYMLENYNHKVTCYDIRKTLYINIHGIENNEYSTVIFYVGNTRVFEEEAIQYNTGLTLIKLYTECANQFLNRVKELAIQRMQTQQVV
jgi:hypothetical protein